MKSGATSSFAQPAAASAPLVCCSASCSMLFTNSLAQTNHAPTHHAHCRCRSLLLLLSFHRADRYGFFAVPVTEDVAPGYFTVIKQPMDLSTIYSRMVEPPGTTARRLRMEAAEFRELFEQICANGMTFNPPQDRVWKEAFRFLQRGTAAFDELLPFTKRGATINEVLKVHADRGRLDAEALVLVAPKPRPIPKEYTLQRRAKEDGRLCARQL